MGETTLDPIVQLVFDLYRTGEFVADWDMVAAVHATALGFEVPTATVYAAVLDTELPGHHRGHVYAVARDGDAADIHQRCARDSDPFIRELCARNAHVSSELLAELATDTSPLVRAQVAKNPNVSGETLVALSKEPTWVGRAAAWELRKRRGSSCAAPLAS